MGIKLNSILTIPFKIVLKKKNKILPRNLIIQKKKAKPLGCKVSSRLFFLVVFLPSWAHQPPLEPSKLPKNVPKSLYIKKIK